MIVGQYYDVSIIVGDLDLLNSGSASNVSCVIKESISTSFPVCKISFNSSIALLNQCPVVDGTNVQIIIKSQLFNINEQYNFRVYDVKAIMNGNNVIYTIECFLDFYELFRSAGKYSLYGNSSDVFSKVAQENNLSGIIHQTRDLQLWATSELNLGKWLSSVAKHGWRSEQSGMYWFLNRTGNLFYIDIDKLIYESKNIAKFQYGETLPQDVDSGTYKYKKFVLHINSGEENIFNRGYDGDNIHFDLLEYTTKTEKANKVRAYSNIVNINKELSQGLGKLFYQFDVGNYHPKYFLAEAQNERILSTFSTYSILSMDRFRDIKLSQVCTLNATNPNSSNTNIKSLNIKYIISDILISISATNISMQASLCTQGYNGTSSESY